MRSFGFGVQGAGEGSQEDGHVRGSGFGFLNSGRGVWALGLLDFP